MANAGGAGATLQQDPFYTVKNQVELSLAGINALFTRWRVLSKSLSVKNADEYRWHTEEIKKTIGAIEWDLQDLEETVTVAAKEQQRFGLSQAEIIDRKTFIANLKKQVASISSEMQQAPPAPVASNKMDVGSYSDFEPGHSSKPSGVGAENVYGQQVMSVRDRQNQQLDTVTDGLQRLHHASVTINEEITDQIDLLETVEKDVEYTNTRMGSALRKIDKLLAHAGDKGALFIVVFLILVLIGLVILVFKT